MKANTEELRGGAAELTAIAEEIEQMANNMNNKVANLCQAWDSTAKPQYEDDFNRVAGNIIQTTEAAKQLASGVTQYADTIDEVEASHSQSKIR